MNSTIQPVQRSRLLLVDDDPDIHDLVACLLESQDIEILSATDFRQALAIAQHEPPDLMLLDYSMPDINGIEMLANLHSAGVPKSIPFVFITGEESHAVLTSCFLAGAADYIRKPFCAPELRARVRSVLDRRRMLSQLEHLALSDSLTNLHNRNSIRSRIQSAIDQSQNTNYGLLYLDFDGFKSVNDTLGHDVGDMLLKEIAARLCGTLRSKDSVGRAADHMTAARVGGDEFVILLEDLFDPNDAMQVAERLLTKLAVPYCVAGHEIRSTASIGVINDLKRYSTCDSAMRDADTAMYEAKSSGKGRCVLFDPSIDHDTKRASAVAELRKNHLTD
jgi:diguanylate cyclase (GGDEF)-like protein